MSTPGPLDHLAACRTIADMAEPAIRLALELQAQGATREQLEPMLQGLDGVLAGFDMCVESLRDWRRGAGAAPKADA